MPHATAQQLLDLHALGVLCVNQVPKDYAWMSETEKHIILYLALAGKDGIHKNLFKNHLKTNPECFINLEVRGLVTWTNNKKGAPEYLILTWKGIDLAEFLKELAKQQSYSNPPKP